MLRALSCSHIFSHINPSPCLPRAGLCAQPAAAPHRRHAGGAGARVVRGAGAEDAQDVVRAHVCRAGGRGHSMTSMRRFSFTFTIFWSCVPVLQVCSATEARQGTDSEHMLPFHYPACVIESMQMQRRTRRICCACWFRSCVAVHELSQRFLKHSFAMHFCGRVRRCPVQFYCERACDKRRFMGAQY